MSLPGNSSEGLGSLPAMSPEKTKRNPRGAGRNPRDGEASMVISMRLTPNEKVLYTYAATEAGMTLTEWIRDTCNARLKRKRRA